MLKEKSRQHQEALQKLGEEVEDEPISENVMILAESQQIKGMNTIIQNPDTNDVDFIFYFDRMSTLLVER
jgi:uridine kinase